MKGCLANKVRLARAQQTTSVVRTVTNLLVKVLS